MTTSGHTSDDIIATATWPFDFGWPLALSMYRFPIWNDPQYIP